MFLFDGTYGNTVQKARRWIATVRRNANATSYLKICNRYNVEVDRHSLRLFGILRHPYHHGINRLAFSVRSET